MKVKMGFISNSSSEAFIIKKEGITPEILKSHLKLLLSTYNTISGKKLLFKNVFGKIVIGDAGDFTILVPYAGNYSGDNGAWLKLEDVIGKIILYSADDNTIPDALVTFLEGVWNGTTRIHLG